jgi:hypothetical protein
VTRSPNGVLLDVQAPAFRARPEAPTSAGLEAVELAASAGLVLDPWQEAFLDDALQETPTGRWASFASALIVPRQNGKGSVLEARELAGLYLFGERLILHSAHEFKTAQEAFLRILALIQSTPDLDRLVQRVRTSHGEEGIELRSGQRLRFVARSRASGRGFTGDLVILDEAYNLSSEAMSALLPTMSARPNPQLWYTSSAPLDKDESVALRKLCKRGRAQARGEAPVSMTYTEFCVDQHADDADPEVWARANPGCPHRISVEHIAKEREELDIEGFRRERLGVWDDGEDDGEQEIPAEAWAECLATGVGIVGAPSLAMDVSIDRAWSTFGAAGRSTLDPARVAVEVVDAGRGTAWVVPRAQALLKKWGGELSIAKGSPAESLVPELVAAGVPVDLVEPKGQAMTCGQLYDAATGGRLHHRGQGVLDVAVNGAAKRPVGDAWVWSRKRSSVDITPLVAVTLAAGQHGIPDPPVMAPASATSDPADSGDLNRHLYRPTGRLDI